MSTSEHEDQSIPKKIRAQVLNLTIGQWIRAVDLVISQHEPMGLSINEEADHVAKAAVFVMLKRWFDDDTICLLVESSSLRLPKRLAKTSKFDIKAILDRPPSQEKEIEQFEPDDPDAPPGADGFSLGFPPAEEQSP